MTDRRGHKKAPSLFLDLENLPGPAKHFVLMHLRVFDWYQTRQVSKCWLAAVDLEVRHMAEGSHLPRDLASRFPGLRTLDLEYCEDRVSAKQLVDALLGLPCLQALLNVYNLDWVPRLIARKSEDDRAKRARLSTGMSSLSFGELLDPHQCKLPRDLANIAKEWKHLRSIRLPHRLSGTANMLTLLKPLKPSLQSLDIQTTELYSRAVCLVEFASLRKLTKLHIDSKDISAQELDCHALSTYTSLRELSINGLFCFQDEGAEFLTRLQMLTALKLVSGNIEPSQIQILSGLTKLRRLEVPGCGLFDMTEFQEAVRRFPSLKELNADGSFFTYPKYTSLPCPPGLTAFTALCYGACGGTTSLRNLHRLVFYLMSGDAIPQLIAANCQQLTYLHLRCGNRATILDQDMPFLGRLQKLQYLGLTNCIHLTPPGLAYLTPLSRLGFLNLSYCNPNILQSPEAPPALARLPLQWLSLASIKPVIESASLPKELRPAFERALSNRTGFNAVPPPEVIHQLCMTAGEAAHASQGRYEHRARRRNGFIDPI